MARPIYSYELGDPDFSWLINNFVESHPEYTATEDSCLPVVFISSGKEHAEFVPGLFPPEEGHHEQGHSSEDGEY